MTVQHARIRLICFVVSFTLPMISAENQVHGQVTSQESSNESQKEEDPGRRSNRDNSSGNVQGIIGNQAGVRIDAIGVLRGVKISASDDLANLRRAAARVPSTTVSPARRVRLSQSGRARREIAEGSSTGYAVLQAGRSFYANLRGRVVATFLRVTDVYACCTSELQQSTVATGSDN